MKNFRKILIKKRMSFNENEIKKDINTIKNILKTNGYYFAKLILK